MIQINFDIEIKLNFKKYVHKYFTKIWEQLKKNNILPKLHRGKILLRRTI